VDINSAGKKKAIFVSKIKNKGFKAIMKFESMI